MINVNGKETKNCKSLSVLLENSGFRRDRIAVEINGEIIKKSDYDKTVLNDGDKIESCELCGRRLIYDYF